MIQACIFDLDGTIINTEHMWAAATEQMLRVRGICYTDELKKQIHDRVHGLPPLQASILVKEMLNLPDCPKDLALEKATRARNLFVGNIHLISGFDVFHNFLKKRKIKTAVATNCDSEFVSLADRQVNLSYYFGDHLYSIDKVDYKCKPDPAIYLLAAERLRVESPNCIAIEDSAPGILAAKRAGMICYGINTSNNKNNLKAADLIIDSYDEILRTKF